MTAVRLLCAALALCASGCASRAVSVELGRSHLRSVAIANYERPSGSKINRLLKLLNSEEFVPVATPEQALVEGSEGLDAEEPSDEVLLEPSAPVKLELALMTEVIDADQRLVLAPVHDGDLLLDGFARVGDGDGIKLHLQAKTECTVYVIHIDASARPQLLFPNELWSTMGNPVLGGRPYRLPQGNVLFELGPVRGLETLYIVASPAPWDELELLLDELAAASWEGPEVPAPVMRATQVTQGLKRMRPTTARAVGGPSGTLTDVPSTLYVGEEGRRLVITRWFSHQ